jgi:hypothetical protein
MRKMILIWSITLTSILGFGNVLVDSNEEITYPPKPPQTTTKEMVNAGKGLVKESKELGLMIVQGGKDDGSIIATVKKHKKFYGSIFIFTVLTLIWLRNRSK